MDLGGPCDTREQLEKKFSGIAFEPLIEEVTEQLDRHGPAVWVPVQKTQDWEDIDWSKQFDEPTSLDLYSDEPSSKYGSLEEREARDKAQNALSHLASSLEKRRPVGIGHNLPPDEIDPLEVKEIRNAVRQLKLEFGQPNPRISVVKHWAAPLRDTLIACSRWAGKKLDKAADAAAAAVGTALGVGLGGLILNQSFPSLHNAFDAIINWLEIAAKTIL
jgi:hypothetical protein